MNTSEIIASIAVVVALFAFVAGGYQWRKSWRLAQLQIFETVYREVRDAERRFAEDFWIPQGKRDLSRQLGELTGKAYTGGAVVDDQALEDARMRTGLSLVTALDFLAFLFNSGRITDKSLKNYYHPQLVLTYENVLQKSLKDILRHPAYLKEVKKLYQYVKAKEPHFNTELPVGSRPQW